MYMRVFIPILVVLLIATSMTMLGFAQRVNRPELVTAATQSRQIVRTYYAELNAFLRGGDIESLASLISKGPPNESMAGGSRCERFSLETGWRALRETYPDLDVRVESEGSLRDYSLVEVFFQTDRIVLPSWIHFENIETPSDEMELFRTNEDLVGDYRTTFDSTMALSLSSSQYTILTHHGRLTISALTFTPDSSGYIRIPGPAMLFVTEGALEVNDEPTLIWTLARHEQTDHDDSRQVLTMGDSVLAPAGDLVVRNSEHGLTSAMLVSVEGPGIVPGPPGVDKYEERAPSAASLIESALRANIGQSSVIRGLHVTPLARSPRNIVAGVGSFDVALVFGDDETSPMSGMGQSIVSVSLSEEHVQSVWDGAGQISGGAPFGCLGSGQVQLVARFAPGN